MDERRLLVNFGFEKSSDSRLPVNINLRVEDLHTDETVLLLDLTPEDFARLLSGSVLTTTGRVRC